MFERAPGIAFLLLPLPLCPSLSFLPFLERSSLFPGLEQIYAQPAISLDWGRLAQNWLYMLLCFQLYGYSLLLSPVWLPQSHCLASQAPRDEV